MQLQKTQIYLKVGNTHACKFWYSKLYFIFGFYYVIVHAFSNNTRQITFAIHVTRQLLVAVSLHHISIDRADIVQYYVVNTGDLHWEDFVGLAKRS